MAVNVVTPSNLGNEFDLGVIEGSKIHIKVDGTSIVRNAGTGVISAVTPATTNDLSLVGTNLTSTVNGVADTQDLLTAIQAGETLTVLAVGATAAAALTYTDEDGTATTYNLTNVIKDGETTTILAYNPATTTLSYTDEDGGVTAVDLSALAADIFVNGGSFNPATLILTLTDNSGTTPDVTVDLSQLLVTVTNNGDGTYTLAQAGSSTVIDTRDGVSADAGNLLTVGTDLKPLLAPATVTALATVDVQDAFGVHQFYAFP